MGIIAEIQKAEKSLSDNQDRRQRLIGAIHSQPLNLQLKHDLNVVTSDIEELQDEILILQNKFKNKD